MTLYARVIHTPIGPLLALVDEDGALVALPFLDAGEDAPAAAARSTRDGTVIFDDSRTSHVTEELLDYFGGRRRRFTLQTAPRGTGFQLSVWHALEAIPFGETIAYAELARRVGNASASRAVGRANGANPIPVVVPCHRVIGTRGDLTGYGGGIERKTALLRLEGALPATLAL